MLNKRFNSVYRLLYGFVARKVSDIDVWYVDEYINRNTKWPKWRLLFRGVASVH